jgi:hypothetical protein
MHCVIKHRASYCNIRWQICLPLRIKRLNHKFCVYVQSACQSQSHIYSNCSTLWAGLYHKNFPINLQEPDNWGTRLLLNHSSLLHIPIALHQFHLFLSNSNTNIPHIYLIRFSPLLPHKAYSYNYVCYYSFQASQFNQYRRIRRQENRFDIRNEQKFSFTAVPTRWLRHCSTSWKFAGSIPDDVIGIFHWHNPSGSTMKLELTQPLTEMSTRNISWGIKAGGA